MNDASTPAEQTPKFDAQVAIAVVGAGLTLAVTMLQTDGPFNGWTSIVGTITLLILHAFDQPTTSFFRHAAFSAVWSLALLATIGVLINGWRLDLHDIQAFWVWLGIAVLCFLIRILDGRYRQAFLTWGRRLVAQRSQPK